MFVTKFSFYLQCIMWIKKSNIIRKWDKRSGYTCLSICIKLMQIAWLLQVLKYHTFFINQWRGHRILLVWKLTILWTSRSYIDSYFMGALMQDHVYHIWNLIISKGLWNNTQHQIAPTENLSLNSCDQSILLVAQIRPIYIAICKI
jgi:hypothetical protein